MFQQEFVKWYLRFFNVEKIIFYHHYYNHLANKELGHVWPVPVSHIQKSLLKFSLASFAFWYVVFY
jgi:hypothetical protein